MPNTMDIKVSIVTPVYNSQDYLSETINSVLSQTHKNWELLITDDCSTDKSVDVAESFAQKNSRVKVTCLKINSGAAIARNKSIELAKGDVIAFIDADDLWDNNFLEKSLAVMEAQKAGIVFSSYRRRSEDLRCDFGEFIVPGNTNYTNMLKSCSISCLTGLFHVQRCQGKVFMPNIRKRQDYCLWLTLLKRVDKAYGIPDVLATYRVCKKSVSRNKLRAACYQWLVYRKIEKIPLVEAINYFIHYTIIGFIKNFKMFKFH